MKNIKLIIGILIITFISSCQDDNSFREIENVDNSDYLMKKISEVMSIKRPDGSVMLQSKTYKFSENTNYSTRIDTKGDSSENNRSKGLSKLSVFSEKGLLVNDSESKSLNNDLSDLYGTTVSVVNSNINANRGSGDGTDVYIPQLLSSIILDGEHLEAGRTISWNVDILNDNGLVFHLAYDPKNQKDVKRAYENQYRITEVFAVTDSQGSYTIQDNDLVRFPADAQLKLTLLRGAFSLDNVGDPSFIALTETSLKKSVKK